MKIYTITETIARAIEIPEDGMGFQEAELERAAGRIPGILINCQYFALLDDAPLLDESRGEIIENRNLSECLFLTPPPSTQIEPVAGAARILDRRLLLEAARTKGARLLATTTIVPFPPHVATTKPGEIYYRLSAYAADRITGKVSR